MRGLEQILLRNFHPISRQNFIKIHKVNIIFMKKNYLVLTIAIGEYHQKISKFTLPSIKKYAEKIGADL
jgi:hypothetical protein